MGASHDRRGAVSFQRTTDRELTNFQSCHESYGSNVERSVPRRGMSHPVGDAEDIARWKTPVPASPPWRQPGTAEHSFGRLRERYDRPRVESASNSFHTVTSSCTDEFVHDG